MEVFLHCEKERCEIVIEQLSTLGFICQSPIPFDYGDISPKSRMAISGQSDVYAKSAWDMREIITEQPWFHKKTMFVQVVGDRMSASSPSLI